MARVLFHKSTQQYESALQEIDQAFEGLQELNVLLHATRSRDDVLALCRTDGGFVSEKALVVAELLVERALLVEGFDEREANFQYALWLYETAVSEGGAALPMDIHERVAWLIEQLETPDE